MTPVEFSTIIQSLLSIGVLTVVVFWLWPAQRTDLFRQQVFAVRDELWDFAASGKIGFDDPAYLLLRQLMNGFIRYAHNLTPYRTFFSYVRWKVTSQPQSEHWTLAWNEALENVSDKVTKDKLQEFHSKVTMLVIGQLLLSPGVIVLVLVPFGVCAIIYRQWTTIRSVYNGVRDTIPMGFLEEEAANS